MGKAEVGRAMKSQRRDRKTREDQRSERVRRMKMQVREKVGKWRTLCCFNVIWLCRVGSRLAKAAGAEHLAIWSDER